MLSFFSRAKPTMSKSKSWITGQDGLAKLKLDEVDVPAPKDGEVLVKILAVSLNYRDTEVIEDTYGHHVSLQQRLTIAPCSDMCGSIISSKSSLWKEGDRVLSTFNQSHLTGQIKESDLASGLGMPLNGVLTQYRVFPETGLVKCPEYLSDEEGACLPIAGVTAWMSINGFQALGENLDYSSGEGRKPTVLLQGTGGVSVAGLQIAHAAGFKTIITSSSDEKLERAKGLGADETVNYRTHWEWQDTVLSATDSHGADIIFETGGSNTLRKSFDCVSFGGTIACIGYLGGKTETPDTKALNINILALRRNVTLKGIINGPKDRFEEMLGFYEKKKIKPVVDKVFGFGDVGEAFGYLVKGDHFGKVVVRVADK